MLLLDKNKMRQSRGTIEKVQWIFDKLKTTDQGETSLVLTVLNYGNNETGEIHFDEKEIALLKRIMKGGE